ncbi:hypothetical protein HUG17_7810 [Dermatophagoides farinae]|uniref:DNA-(apurinic or apyrimidinic site) endonuclease n=1 Tax=Dermatophagoides farinae TaxID=6954 RepID=A0A9D4SG26_DERFA|nr:hypothetical protein HUG17_7810 [Dermatophagoides farinae]
MGFKIITWNINGLRSFGGPQQFRPAIFEKFDGQADMVCLQETKLSRSSLTEWMAFVSGYTSYFSFPSSEANHLSHQSGYSGVATYVRENNNCRPWAAEVTLVNDVFEIFAKDLFDHLEEDSLFEKRWSRKFKRNADSDYVNWRQVDREGRCIVTKHAIQIGETDASHCHGGEWLYLFNLYCPRNDSSRPDRELFQLKFYHLVERRIKALFEDNNSRNHVIVVGDLNTAHQPIDVYNDAEFGYLGSNSRIWLQELLDDGRLVDAFRHMNGDVTGAFTCWNSQIGGRYTNYGSRIDYILVDRRLCPYMRHCYHLTSVVGSDHCPVMAQFDDQIRFIGPDHQYYSVHCTKQWPEFDPIKQRGSIRHFLTTTKPNINQNQNDQFGSSSSDQIIIKNLNQIRPQQQPLMTTQTIANDEATTVTIAMPNQSEKWRQLLDAKSKIEHIPLCTGHGLPCVRRKVRKTGINYGREFYQCSKPSLKPEGHPETRCNFFRWIK